MTIGNPDGLWALAAIPVIVLIHFLQERSRRVRVSTLFLLEHMRPRSVGGARLDRFRQSLPLWMQLLATLVITWLLMEPRWVRTDSRQTVAVVLDSSASMQAFSEAIGSELRTHLAPWRGAAAETEWILMETDLRQPRAYRGDSFEALLQPLESFEPLRGAHDPLPALALARSLVKEEGAVVLVTDRIPERLPEGVGLLAVGESFANVGFVGSRIERGGAREERWSALLRNAGEEAQTRRWWIEWPGAETAPREQTVQLEPGETRTLQGGFPEGQDRVWLRMEEDAFELDDRLPLRRPEPKVLQVEMRLEGVGGELFTRMLDALEQVEVGRFETPDLVVHPIGTAAEGHGIQVVGGSATAPPLDPDAVVADAHPLTAGLDWSGLLTPTATRMALGDEDQPLLWKGELPLAWLRRESVEEGLPRQRLMLAFDPVHSSAERNPAFVVLLHRFAAMLREQKRSFTAGNFETDQEVAIARGSGEDLILTSDTEGASWAGRTPRRPGFFEVSSDGEPLLSGAAAFGDPREGDFALAARLETVGDLRRRAALRQSEADPWTPVWLVILLALLLVSWMPRGGRRLAA